MTRFAEFGQDPDLVAGSEFRSQDEGLSAVKKSLRGYRRYVATARIYQITRVVLTR